MGDLGFNIPSFSLVGVASPTDHSQAGGTSVLFGIKKRTEPDFPGMGSPARLGSFGQKNDYFFVDFLALVERA
jgi:hypothetical protein